TGTNKVVSEMKRTNDPCFLDHVWNLGRENGRAIIAALELVHRASEFPCHIGSIDIVVAEDSNEVGIGGFENFQQEVFDFNVEVGLRDAELRGRFKSLTAWRAELRDE